LSTGKDSAGDLTILLNRISAGDEAAIEQLISIVYPELRKIAAKRLRAESAGHSLQTTDLANEAYLRIFGAGVKIPWQNRAHFFAIVARQIRFIIIEHARKRKRGGHLTVSLAGVEGSGGLGVAVWTDEGLLALDEALQQLAEVDARAAMGVVLRFFGGLTQEEIAAVQGIDLSTVKRDWVYAKSWLYDRLNPENKTN
jgi:RNA polymerase sigma factor (TIGR02999 family)